jgi:hypothetical protein
METNGESSNLWAYQDEFLKDARRLLERVCLQLAVQEPPRLGFFAAGPQELAQRRRLAITFPIPPATAGVRKVIKEELRSPELSPSTVSLVSSITRLAGEDCVFVLDFPKPVFETYPHLALWTPKLNQWLDVGLLKSAGDALLNLFSAEAAKGNGGLSHGMRRAEVDDLLRRSGERLLWQIQAALGWHPLSGSLFEQVNTICSLRYESADANATIRLSPEGEEESFAVRFKEKVPLADAVWARKALQLAKDPMLMLSDSEHFLGLRSKESAGPEGFEIRIKDLNHWELSHANTILADIRLGIPSFPRPRIQRDDFEKTFRRIFSERNGEGEERIWQLVQSILSGKHGALIVVADIAAAEAERLCQSMRIEPTLLTENVALRAIAIDGAILLDPSGTCHAIGVILDGKAYAGETPSRGARFNSAARYVMEMTENASRRLAVVVSEDGQVDLLPKSLPHC